MTTLPEKLLELTNMDIAQLKAYVHRGEKVEFQNVFGSGLVRVQAVPESALPNGVFMSYRITVFSSVIGSCEYTAHYRPDCWYIGIGRGSIQTAGPLWAGNASDPIRAALQIWDKHFNTINRTARYAYQFAD